MSSGGSPGGSPGGRLGGRGVSSGALTGGSPQGGSGVAWGVALGRCVNFLVYRGFCCIHKAPSICDSHFLHIFCWLALK